MRCLAKNKKKERCGNKGKISRMFFCKDHSLLKSNWYFIKNQSYQIPITILSSVVIFIFLAIITWEIEEWWSKSSYREEIVNTAIPSKKIEECNPYYSSIGCRMKLTTQKGPYGSMSRTIMRTINGEQITVSKNLLNINYEGGLQDYMINVIDSIPHYLSLPPYHEDSPYKISVKNGEVLFKCLNFKDYKSGTQLGWFNETRFKVDHVSEQGCAYKICKDTFGIEIINKDHEVAFSVSYSENKNLIFRGAYELDSIYYVFDGSFKHEFKTVTEAEKLVDRFPPVFDWTTEDGYGNCKRIIYPKEPDNIWKGDPYIKEKFEEFFNRKG